jgi:hypothetical protein
MLEDGEDRDNVSGQRVVRVGTHVGEKAGIEGRIAAHATDWGLSVFRRHVGTALIREGAFDASIDRGDRDRWVLAWFASVDGWAVHANKARLDRTLHAMQDLVTQAIAGMRVLWVEVDNIDDRLELERQSIRLLSNYLRSTSPIDPPSDGWLGRHALREEVRLSGLWNVLHVKKLHWEGFLDHFEEYFTHGQCRLRCCPTTR